MQRLIRLLSRRNWGVLRYNSVFQNLAALFYIGLSQELFGLPFLGYTLLFFLFSTLMTGYGYFVNDLGDVELDRQHGKPNAFLNMPRGKAVRVVGLMLAAGLAGAAPFLFRVSAAGSHAYGYSFLAALLVWIATASAYSLPPLRLKERGGLGLAATVAAQQSLPALLLMLGFIQRWDWGLLAFLLYATLRGISSDVGHQIRDFSADASTGTRTFAVSLGWRRACRVYAAALEAERLSFGLVVVVIAAGLSALRLPLLGQAGLLGWLPALAYFALLAVTLGRSWNAYEQGSLAQEDPYSEALQAQRFSAKGGHFAALHLTHHTFPSVLLPLYLGVLASLVYLPNALLIVAIVMLFGLYRAELWRGLFARLPRIGRPRKPAAQPGAETKPGAAPAHRRHPSSRSKG